MPEENTPAKVTPREHAKLVSEARDRVVVYAVPMRDLYVECRNRSSDKSTPCGVCAACRFCEAVDNLRGLQAIKFRRGRPAAADGEPTEAEREFLHHLSALWVEGGEKEWPTPTEVATRAEWSRQRGFALAGRLIAKGLLIKERGTVRLPMAGLLP